MSGKQDKKSRRLKQSIDREFGKAMKKVEQAQLDRTAITIGKYHAHLRSLSIWDRFKFCWSLLFGQFIDKLLTNIKNLLLFPLTWINNGQQNRTTRSSPKPVRNVQVKSGQRLPNE